MDAKQVWPLIHETMVAFAPFYRSAMQAAIRTWELPDNWFPLSLARGAQPAPLSLDRYHDLTPYTARAQCAQALERLAGLAFLERVGLDAYRLTDTGREALDDVFGAAHAGLADVHPLPEEALRPLNALLSRLVAATLEAPEPQEKWAIVYSRWTDPGAGATGSVVTDQYLTDLLRFRDDAHMAAWKPYGVSGHAWEALTFLWRDQAHAAKALAEQLSFRGHSPEAYAQALAGLADRGWVQVTSDGYQITEQGRTLRQRAEDATDHYFFAPWADLSASEIDQLGALLTRLRDHLQSMVEANED